MLAAPPAPVNGQVGHFTVRKQTAAAPAGGAGAVASMPSRSEVPADRRVTRFWPPRRCCLPSRASSTSRCPRSPAGPGCARRPLCYWFRRKEEILAEIVEQVNRVPLDFVLKLEEEAGDPAVQLWRLVRFDVAALCAFPFDIDEVHRLSRRAPDAPTPR